MKKVLWLARIPLEFTFVDSEWAANSEIMKPDINDHDMTSKSLVKVSVFVLENSTTL